MTSPSHIIIIGSGLAGLSAAIEAERQGSFVTLLEKTTSIGGNSAKATSGINGVKTPAQLANNIEDSAEAFKKDTLVSGAGFSNQSLVNTLTNQSTSAIAFLESFNISLSVLSQCGGHSAPRTHREAPKADGKPAPVGWDIISALKAYLLQKSTAEPERIKIIQQAHVKKLITCMVPNKMALEDDFGKALNTLTHVTGVEYVDGNSHSEKTLSGDAVILATGGFACDHTDTSLIREFAPHLQNLSTTNGAFAQGDGVKFSRSIGAKLVDMDKVQVHPTGFVDPAQPTNPVKFLAPEALRGCGGIIVNSNGNRFVNELGLRDYVSESIFRDSEKLTGQRENATAYLILNKKAVEMFGKPTLDFYKSKGLFREFENATTTALTYGIDPGTLANTLTSYGISAASGKPDEFGKTVFPVLFTTDEPLYIACITPTIHYTMGGVAISPSAEVLDVNGYPILGLFGAGEVTGGVHGNNRLAGNSLLECVVFGRIAGKRASEIRLTSQPALAPDTWTSLRFRGVENAPGSTFCKVFSFDLPSPLHHTGLAVGEYISVRAICAPVDLTTPAPSSLPPVEPQEVIRYYSPISRPNDLGHIDLLIKVDDKGIMSQHLNSMVPGDHLDFKGPMGGLHIDWKKKTKIGLVCGGTGISPMLQIIRQALYDDAEVSMKLMWGVMEIGELFYQDKLNDICARFPNKLSTYYVINKPPAGWRQGSGFIDAETLKKEMFPPGDDVLLVLCGPPGMCKAIKPVFESLGYTKDMYFSFM